MSKQLLSAVMLSLGATLCACEGSFVNPNDQITPDPIDSVLLEKSKWYDTKTNDYVMTGLIQPEKSRCNDTVPRGSRVIVGWELPYHSPKKNALYFCGSGAVDPNRITKGYWKDDYNLSIIIDSLLPKQVIWYNPDSSQVLAVGHIFLAPNNGIKDGDTLLYSELFMSDILGGVTKSAVVFQKGYPMLLGKPLGDTVAQGFNFMRGYKNIFGPPDPDDMKATYVNSSPFIFIKVDDNSFDTQRYNPMWLP